MTSRTSFAARSRRSRRSRGQALVEFVLVVPVLLVIVFGLIEVGFIINAHTVLDDTVRQAAHYGAMAGRTDDSSGSLAPGCLADYTVLADIRDSLQGTTIDTSHIRSIFIYAGDTDNGTDLPRVTPSGTSLPPDTDNSGFPGTYPNVGLNGDYYYSDYNPSTGADVDDSAATLTGTGQGAIYKLFHGGTDQIFSHTLVNGYYSTPPACGSAIASTYTNAGGTHNCFPYADNSTTGAVQPTCVVGTGNWPPLWRNNFSDKVVDPENPAQSTPWPDSFGVDITYDYQFHTPIFQVISNIFLGNSHIIRMSAHVVFTMSPA